MGASHHVDVAADAEVEERSPREQDRRREQTDRPREEARAQLDEPERNDGEGDHPRQLQRRIGRNPEERQHGRVEDQQRVRCRGDGHLVVGYLPVRQLESPDQAVPRIVRRKAAPEDQVEHNGDQCHRTHLRRYGDAPSRKPVARRLRHSAGPAQDEKPRARGVTCADRLPPDLERAVLVGFFAADEKWGGT